MDGTDSAESVGVEVTPDMIAALLEKGLVETKSDGRDVVLMYDTVPRTRSPGWNE